MTNDQFSMTKEISMTEFPNKFFRGVTRHILRSLNLGHSLVILIALFAPVPLTHADSLLLRNATVHTVTKGTLSPGDVLIKDGRIAAVAAKIADPADRTLDLTGLHLFPGLVSPSTDLGLVEISGVRAVVDDRETGEFTPEVQSWMSVNPDSELIPVARANGLTHFASTPQ
jgi:imidazolonepropionase-like amidohydrolase